MFKFLVWHVLLVTVSCELFNQEVGYSLEYAPTYNDYKPRDYHFNYAVSDPHTGDHKSQWEVKINGVVRGGYSLLEPDGTTRVVEYVADDHGFRAIVKKLGTAIHPVPVVPVVPEVAHFRAYDGQVNNYGNLYQLKQNLGVGGEPLIASPQASGVIQGQNLERIEAVPVAQEVELKRIEDYLARIEAIPVAQGQELRGSVEGRIEAVPQQDRTGSNLGTNGQVFTPAGVGGYNVDVNLGAGQNLGRIEAVPQLQRYGVQVPQGPQVYTPEGVSGYNVDVGLGSGQNLEGYGGQIGTIQVSQGTMDAILAKYGIGGIGSYNVERQNLGRIEPPLQSHGGQVLQGSVGANVGRYGLGGLSGQVFTPAGVGGYNVEVDLSRGQNLGRIETVPPFQGHGGQGTVQANVGRYGLEGQVFTPVGVGGYRVEANLGGGQNLGGIEAVPVPQTQNLGSAENVAVSDGQNLQRIADNHLGQISNLVPVSPSYSTSIEYHGLTGNPEDDSRYSNDDYRGSSSQRVQKVVPAPITKGHSEEKRGKSVKEQFLIYIPDTESH